MSKANPVITNFTSGEISPLTKGRSDVSKYNNGADEILNGIVLPQGGVMRRPGTRFVGEVADSSKTHRLIPFQFSNTQAYLLELGDNTLRIWDNNVIKLGGSRKFVSGSALGSGPPYTNYIRITVTAHGITDSDTFLLWESGTTSYNKLWTPGTFTVNSSADNIYFDTDVYPATSLGGWISELPLSLTTPWGEDDVADIQFAQIADTMWLVHPDYAPRVLRRRDEYRWDLTLYDPVDGPYLTDSSTVRTFPIQKISEAAGADAGQIKIYIPAAYGFNASSDQSVVVKDAPAATGASGVWRTKTDVSGVGHVLKSSTYAASSQIDYNGIVDFRVKFTLSDLTDSATVYATHGDSFASIAVGDYFELRWRNKWTLWKCLVATADNEVKADFQEHALLSIDPEVIIKAKVKRTTSSSDNANTTTFTKKTVAKHSVTGKKGGTETVYVPASSGEVEAQSGRVNSSAGIETLSGKLGLSRSGIITQYDLNKYIRLTQDGAASGDPDPVVAGEASANWVKVTSVYYEQATGLDTAKVSAISPAFDWAAETGSITNVLDDGGGQCSVTSAGHGLNTGDYVTVSSVVGVPGANGSFFITVSNADTFVLVGSTFSGSYSSGGSWTSDPLPNEFEVVNRSVTATLTASVPTFASTDVGRYVRIKLSGVWVRGRITAYTSTTVVTIEIDWEFNEVPADTENPDRIANYGVCEDVRLGAWSDTTGWPSAVTFHDGRLVFAATDTEPLSVWATVTDDYWLFQPTEFDGEVADDLGWSATVVASQVNRINWLNSGGTLMVGTTDGEWIIRAASGFSDPITQSDILVVPQTTVGSRDYRNAVRVGQGVLFIQRKGVRVYDILYSFENDSFVANDLTVISEHILRKGSYGKRIVYQNQPYSLVWVLLNNGALACLTLDRQNQVAAWTYHTIGGSGTVEDICVLSNSTGTEDVLYMIVNRTINGGTERYIEFIRPFEYPSSTTDTSGSNHLDCSSSFIAAANGIVTVGSRFEGMTINAFSGGVWDGTDYVVASGAIDTAYTAGASVFVGYPFTSRIHTLPIEGGSPWGSAMGKTKRTATVSVRTYLSPYLYHGTDTSALVLETLNSGNMFSGDTRLKLRDSYDLAGDLYLQAYGPHAMTILAVYPQQNTFE